ncbi:MAG TPA: QsdR family transcriptional regulator [Nevskiaceae bacterium]|nr:QsdR family transcriptional regulator [Nevskiaceae bacterium]
MAALTNTPDGHLARAFSNPRLARRVTPQQAFEQARKQWLAGSRIEIGTLARDLGISRNTLFRWVGSRDLLLTEIIWYVFKKTWDRLAASTPGVGADYIADFTRRLMNIELESEPFRVFFERDPEYALRILTSKKTPFQNRVVAASATMIRQQTAAGHLRPALAPDDLAYAFTRLVEAGLYGDQLTGRPPNVAVTCEAVRILAAAHPRTPQPPAQLTSRRST